MREFIFLWPTVRPDVMRKTYEHWMKNRVTESPVAITIAVNTKQQRAALHDFSDVIIVGDDKKGPVHATNMLSRRVSTDKNSIILLISDDFFAPSGWDRYLLDVFSDFDGGVIVDDGYQRGGCVTIPIMTYNCLLRLNRIIYHPSYVWQFSDAELYHNMSDLKCLKDLRKSSPLFEHRHWANGKRVWDANDEPGRLSGGHDNNNFNKRMKLPVRERLGLS